MPDPKKKDETTGVETTGHSWDGIEELNNPLPRWWLWTLYLTIIWGIGYTIAYPAWPMINGATKGLLGYSTRAEVAKDIADHHDKNADLVLALTDSELDAVDSDLLRYAVARGGSVFRAQCSQCHGSGAAGAVGYPNLLDDDWLWGGTKSEIAYSITHGIRNESDFDAHWSQMPAFEDALEKTEIDAVVEYVIGLSSTDVEGDLVQLGAQIYSENCAVCHADNATGDASIGAPNLADAIWLYGSDRQSIATSVREARFGVMPAWGQRLSDEDVRAVTLYVHGLGGGE